MTLKPLYKEKPSEPAKSDWLQEGFEHIWLPYTQMQDAALPLPVVDAYGCRIKLADGRELIDGISSWWSVCHGYKHQYIVDAIKNQTQQLSHVMFGGLASEPAYTLAKRLVEISPDGLSRVFFSDSGSVAVEVAMKMAVQYWRNKNNRNKTKLISFHNAYHGDTMGAMSVSDDDDWIHKVFKGYGPEQIRFAVPDENTLEQLAKNVAAIKDSAAAIIIEPLVQGAGGFKFHSPLILKEIYEIAKKNDLLFIADEIATGFGRTGTMFACEQAGVTPDIMCLGKALTGGYLGLAATLATEDIFTAFLSDDYGSAFMHGPTYMGNPLACAAANASLDLFAREPRLDQIEKIQRLLLSELEICRELEIVKDVRVKGAIGVVELKETDWKKIKQAREKFIEMGVWLRPFGNVFYIMPPFTISTEELEQLTAATYSVLKD